MTDARTKDIKMIIDNMVGMYDPEIALLAQTAKILKVAQND